MQDSGRRLGGTNKRRECQGAVGIALGMYHGLTRMAGLTPEPGWVAGLRGM